MKKIIIIVIIVALGILLSFKKPIKIVQSTSAQVTEQNIGLPTQEVKNLRKILTP